MLEITTLQFNPFGVNTYLIYDTETRDTAVVDPGMFNTKEQRFFDTYVAEHNLKITQIINTHLHLDHCFGDNYVKSRYGVPVKANSADAFLGAKLAEQSRRFGMLMPGTEKGVEIDVDLKDGETVKVGKHELKVLQVPGHSPGSIALYSPEYHFLIGGDVLFKGSIGRTDLEQGNMSTLINSIRNKILTLPGETQVLPGHNAITTVADEKRYNPYFN